jgi:hypothetical protein
VLQAGTEFRGELRLAQPHAVPDLRNIDVRDLNPGDTDGNIFALRPGDCFFETFDDPSAHAGAFLHTHLAISLFHLHRFLRPSFE